MPVDNYLQEKLAYLLAGGGQRSDRTDIQDIGTILNEAINPFAEAIKKKRAGVDARTAAVAHAVFSQNPEKVDTPYYIETGKLRGALAPRKVLEGSPALGPVNATADWQGLDPKTGRDMGMTPNYLFGSQPTTGADATIMERVPLEFSTKMLDPNGKIVNTVPGVKEGFIQTDRKKEGMMTITAENNALTGGQYTKMMGKDVPIDEWKVAADQFKEKKKDGGGKKQSMTTQEQIEKGMILEFFKNPAQTEQSLAVIKPIAAKHGIDLSAYSKPEDIPSDQTDGWISKLGGGVKSAAKKVTQSLMGGGDSAANASQKTERVNVNGQEIDAPSFATEAEAEKAKLPKGSFAVIGGKIARVK